MAISVTTCPAPHTSPVWPPIFAMASARTMASATPAAISDTAAAAGASTSVAAPPAAMPPSARATSVVLRLGRPAITESPSLRAGLVAHRRSTIIAREKAAAPATSAIMPKGGRSSRAVSSEALASVERQSASAP